MSLTCLIALYIELVAEFLCLISHRFSIYFYLYTWCFQGGQESIQFQTLIFKNSLDESEDQARKPRFWDKAEQKFWKGSKNRFYRFLCYQFLAVLQLLLRGDAHIRVYYIQSMSYRLFIWRVSNFALSHFYISGFDEHVDFLCWCSY